MRKELIEIIFNEFEHDKEIIKKNLLFVMDTILLEATNDNEKIILQIKIERIDKNVKNNKKENMEQLDKTK